MKKLRIGKAVFCHQLTKYCHPAIHQCEIRMEVKVATIIRNGSQLSLESISIERTIESYINLGRYLNCRAQIIGPTERLRA